MVTFNIPNTADTLQELAKKVASWIHAKKGVGGALSLTDAIKAAKAKSKTTPVQTPGELVVTGLPGMLGSDTGTPKF